MTIMAPVLKGYHVLVVEDEYVIAHEITEVLLEAGAKTIGPAPSIKDALRLIAANDRIDCALLDVNLRGKAIWPVVEMLLARKIPLVLSTAYSASALPQVYAHLPRCEKPAGKHRPAE